MDNKMTDWRDLDLQDDETEMLESIENGEWQSIGNLVERQSNLRKMFSINDVNSNSININIDNEVFDIILNKSKQYGISYKELIEKLVNNFALNKVAL